MKRLKGKKPKKHSLGDKIQYKFDSIMSRGGSSILMGLIILIVLSLVIMLIFRILIGAVIHDSSLQGLPNMFWRSLVQIVDAGGIGEDSNSHIFNKFAGLVSVLLGLVIFSVLVAFIINQFNIKAEDLRKGRSKVIEQGHMIILGFGIQVVEIIQQLIIANETGEKKAIVILADTDKAAMDDLLTEEIKDRKNTRIITRSGDVCNTKMIQRLSLAEARAVIILNDANVAALPKMRDQGDAKVLEACIAVVTAAGANNLPPVVAQLHSDKTSRLAENIAPEKITVIDTNDILARILVSTSLNPGLAFVYSRLVGFEGYEMYFHRPKAGWRNHPFGKLQFHFIISVLLGFRTPEAEIILNPRLDFIPPDDYEGIFLAAGVSHIKYYKKQAITPQEQKFFMKKSRIILENQLIVGWNSKIMIIVDEYAKSMRDGSSIDIVVKEPSDTTALQIKILQETYRNIKIKLLDSDISDPDFIEELNPHKYDNVVILAEESESVDEVDLKTISRLLAFRDFIRNKEIESGKPITTKLVTEVIDSDKADIFFQAGARDFLIPHKFVSEIIAQISQQPDLKKVYDSIFEESGNAIYVKPVDLFFRQIPVTASFADCMGAAQLRGEVCLGVKIGEEATNIEKNYGMYLPPYKNMIFNLAESDSLITLAENRN